MILGVREMPKPVICRLQGVGAGAGASLAFACDIIVASESATLVQAFANIRTHPTTGSSYFLLRLSATTKHLNSVPLAPKSPPAKPTI